MLKLSLVAAFGALGSILRYLVSGWGQRLAGGDFPAGILAVNLLGCLGIGLAGAYFSGARLVHEDYRLAIVVGLLGGFTTFSSFAWESFLLARGGKDALALGNVVASNVLGIACVWLAFRLGVRLFGPG